MINKFTDLLLRIIVNSHNDKWRKKAIVRFKPRITRQANSETNSLLVLIRTVRDRRDDDQLRSSLS